MIFAVEYEKVTTTTGTIEIEADTEDDVYEIFDRMVENGEIDMEDDDLWDENVEITMIDPMEEDEE